MHNNSAMALVGLVFGAVFLVLAFASTVSKVTLSVFNPWLGRQIRHRDHPRTFITVVLIYWLFGAAAVVFAIVSLASRT
jgi:type IV secretory pathway VirB2 component (pilin)